MEDLETHKEPGIAWPRAVAILGMLVLAVLFWGSPALYPLRLLVVFFHELSHAIAAWATGGRVVEIQILPGAGGLCITQGGSRFLTLNAGYLGSLVWGGIMLTTARKPKAGQVLLGVLAAILIVTAIVFVRPVASFGLVFSLATGVVMAAVAYAAPAQVSALILQFTGLLSMLYVLVDIKADILDRPDLVSDATMLAEHTGIPGFVWGLAWLAIALALSAAFLRDACMPSRRPS